MEGGGAWTVSVPLQQLTKSEEVESTLQSPIRKFPNTHPNSSVTLHPYTFVSKPPMLLKFSELQSANDSQTGDG
ncbi:hypothetical protein DM860_007824 [Cuscuta australis]|uniref:Uncharacterized protein n=1 Tax=Cuscuta australis TaxID=267555 RepID=A0A328DY53_9ASTE|nr:hypothetical protein DM860_007824 [Cuscuta australis]